MDGFNKYQIKNQKISLANIAKSVHTGKQLDK